MARKRNYTKSTKSEIKKVVKSELKKNIELKKVSSGVAATEMFLGDITGGGQTLFQISAIAQGDGDNERVGDKVRLAGLNWKYWVQNGLGAAAPANTLVRVLMFQYKGPSAAENSLTFMNKLFIPDTSAGGGDKRGPMANRNTDYMDLFNIIYDKVHTMCGTQTASVPVPPNYAHFVTKYLKLSKCAKIINYVNGSTTSGNNNIFVLIWSFNNSVTDNPTFSHEFQLHYTDA